MFRSAPISTFYLLIFGFPNKYGIDMKYGMSNSRTGRKWFGLYPDCFRISRILSGYPVFANSVYIVFTTVCVAIAMSLLNLPSECGIVSCDYVHYYAGGCELVFEVVNDYHGLQLLVLLSFVMYSCRVRG